MKKLLALCGMLSGVVFLLALILFGALTPGYSHLSNAVSELGMQKSSFPMLFNLTGFLLPGILAVLFSAGFYINTRPHIGSLLVTVLTGISGLGFALLGVFPAANNFGSSVETQLHFTMVTVNYLPFLMLTFLYPFRVRHPHWIRLKFFALATGVIAISSFFIPPSLLPAGISQRLGLGIYFVWLFVMGLSLYKQPNGH